MRGYPWLLGVLLLGIGPHVLAQDLSGPGPSVAAPAAGEASAQPPAEQKIDEEPSAKPADDAADKPVDDTAATKPADDAADKGTLSAEMPLAVLPTHWKAEKPVGNGAGPVTADMLKQAGTKTDEWLMYGGDYRNTRHSPLKSINPTDVGKLRVAWGMPTGTLGQFAVSPVLYDGVLYVSSSYNRLFAVDPKSGTVLWRYDHQLPGDLRICCGPANRGVAIDGDYVFMGTLDAKLIAFDRRTGEIAWTTTIVNYLDGYSITSAPLVADGLVVIGIAGGEFGVRGFFDAYDAKTGKRVWRHYTVPDKGEPGAETWAADSYKTGGAPAWNTGAYDAETDTLFWTVGNPSPDWNGDLRQGDNLYSNSVLAIEPKTGKLKWHFQFTPHDVWDYDGNTHIFLVDIPYEGKTLKALLQPNRNGYYYILDRETGKFLKAVQYVDQLNWSKGIDEAGRPIVDPRMMPADEPTERVCPSNLGGLNGAWTASYDPSLNMVFVPEIEACQLFQKGLVAFVKGIPFMGGMPTPLDGQQGKSYGNLKALDASTGKTIWTYRDPKPMMGGTLTTAGGVVFTSNIEGDALAFESKTGKELWRFHMGGAGRSQPIAFELDGEPYVAFGSGGFSTLESFAGAEGKVAEGGNLYMFKIAKDDLSKPATETPKTKATQN